MATASDNALVKQQAGPGPNVLEKVLVQGDLTGLRPEERIFYYKEVCGSLGLNPYTKPFEYITLNGKLRLYALKDCTDQLRSLRNISIKIVSREVVEGVYVVTAQASMQTSTGPRCDESIGAVPIDNLKGESRANAMMKGETKSKRRVTLSICGLGMLDETEVDSIPGAVVGGGEVPKQEQPSNVIEMPAQQPAAANTVVVEGYAIPLKAKPEPAPPASTTEAQLHALRGKLIETCKTDDKKLNLAINAYLRTVLNVADPRSADKSLMVEPMGRLVDSLVDAKSVESFLTAATAYGMNLYKPADRPYESWSKKTMLLAQEVCGNRAMSTIDDLARHLTAIGIYDQPEAEIYAYLRMFAKSRSAKLVVDTSKRDGWKVSAFATELDRALGKPIEDAKSAEVDTAITTLATSESLFKLK